MKFTKDDLIKLAQKGIRLIVFILMIIAILLFIILLPDLIFHIRGMFKKIPLIKKILFYELDDKEYVQLMMGALINCIAVSVSISAFYVAKAVSKTHIEKHKQDILISATSIVKHIKKNSYVIYEIKIKGTGDIKELLFDKEFEKYIFCLFTAKIITSRQRELIQSYSNKISKIREYHETGQEKHKNEKLDEYCKEFLKADAEGAELNDTMQEIINTLIHIGGE